MVVATRHDLGISLVMSLFIAIISYIGDYILRRSKNLVIRAVSDNLTHAVVGGLTWSIVLKLSKKSLLKNGFSIFFAFLISSLIDLDHFLLAKSWKLSDATNLPGRRPLLHCSTLPIIVWFFLVGVSKFFQRPTIACNAWLMLASFSSHHLRDATRRGFWIAPFGSTQPVEYHVYLLASAVLPSIIYLAIPNNLLQNQIPASTYAV